MARQLYIGTHGSDDPTKATMPFLVAAASLDRGHEPAVAAMGEAVYLLKTEIMDSVKGVGFPPLSELFAKLVEHAVPVYV